MPSGRTVRRRVLDAPWEPVKSRRSLEVVPHVMAPARRPEGGITLYLRTTQYGRGAEYPKVSICVFVTVTRGLTGESIMMRSVPRTKCAAEAMAYRMHDYDTSLRHADYVAVTRASAFSETTRRHTIPLPLDHTYIGYGRCAWITCMYVVSSSDGAFVTHDSRLPS